ncbi:hypothetical protein IKG02_02070 [Candidatus Saccharibacteria bacterium]|nr:hypothetical protein [Candidatus Saccharibacteria bacterium]
MYSPRHGFSSTYFAPQDGVSKGYGFAVRYVAFLHPLRLNAIYECRKEFD